MSHVLASILSLCTPPLSQVLVHVLPVYPLNQRTGHCHAGTSRRCQVLIPAQSLHPLYHKYWSLSYRYITYITNTGSYPTGLSPKSTALVPACRYIPYITITDPCNTVLSKLNVHSVLLLYPLCHKYWSLSYRYILYIIVLDTVI